MRDSVAELKKRVKEDMEKLFPDDWEDRFDELSVKMPKKEWLAKLNELNRAIHAGQYAHMECQVSIKQCVEKIKQCSRRGRGATISSWCGRHRLLCAHLPPPVHRQVHP